MTERIRELIMQHANATTIAGAALADGDLNLLRDAALAKACEGTTTIAEAVRVTKG
jgi:type II secretory ATPase GspE/PulE/Tfp pilus assembly ATPase PilB-like protein